MATAPSSNPNSASSMLQQSPNGGGEETIPRNALGGYLDVIPIELLDQIFGATFPNNRKTLSSLAKVSKTFRDAVKRLLYRSHKYDTRFLGQCDRYLRSLKEDPNLGHHVKTFSMVGRAIQWPFSSHNHEHNITEVLAVAPKLQTISLRNAGPEIPIFDILERAMLYGDHHHKFMYLTAIDIELQNLPERIQVLLYLPVLRSLSLSNLRLEDADQIALLQKAKPSKSIRVLRLLRSHIQHDGFGILLSHVPNTRTLLYQIDNLSNPTRDPQHSFLGIRSSLVQFEPQLTSLNIGFANTTEAFNGDEAYSSLHSTLGSLKQFDSLTYLKLPLCILLGRNSVIWSINVQIGSLLPLSLEFLSLYTVRKDYDPPFDYTDRLMSFAKTSRIDCPDLKTVELRVPDWTFVGCEKLKAVFKTAKADLIVIYYRTRGLAQHRG